VKGNLYGTFKATYLHILGGGELVGGRYQDFWKMCFSYLWVSVKDLGSVFALKVWYPHRMRLS